MNRILFEPSEIKGGVATVSDARAEHILTFLHGEVGQTLKTGEVNGKIGTGEIVAIKNAAGELSTDRRTLREAKSLEWCASRYEVTIRVNHTEESLKPWVDLILAPPRPRAMKRLLPQLTQLGVGRIFLVGAKKVEKDFWGATLLKEENYRPLLIDGLMQAGTSILPTIETRRNFKRFIEDEVDDLWPNSTRIVAHPYTKDGDHDHSSFITHHSSLLLAIGPEGGWTDEEVALLETKGFERYSLGPRILKTDTAVVALIARFMNI